MNPAALFDIGGRSAIVTGASGSFGQAASRALAAAGARVAAAGGNADKLESLASEIAAAGGEAAVVARRPDTEDDAAAIVAAAGRAHGGVDILEDFAGALLYFVSPASDFCTGQVFYVDGGYTAG